MTKALATQRQPAAMTLYTEQAQTYARASKAANTLRAYASAWKKFAAWAESVGRPALPAEVGAVVDYLAKLAEDGARVSTISVARAAISAAHALAHLPDPAKSEDVKMVMAGISRKLGAAPVKKSPLTLDELRAATATLPATLAGKRDRALLLLGWAGAFRRSELVALDMADSVRRAGELKITVRRSKTDQTGEGLVKVIPALKDKTICPVEALREWEDAAHIRSGPIFRQIDRWGNVRARAMTSQCVALTVKAAARRAGLDWRRFSGHSLRSGFITAAALAGVESRDIMAQSGHKSFDVMRSYIQDAGLGAKRATRAAFGEKRP